MKFEYVPILLGGIFKATNNKSPGRDARRHQEQARVPCGSRPSASSSALGSSPTPESVLPGQHAEPDARRRSPPSSKACSRNMSRPRSTTCGSSRRRWTIPKSRPRRWPHPASMRAKLLARVAGRRRQGKADREHAIRPSSAARSARRPSSSASEMFFGKEQLREVEEMVSGSRSVTSWRGTAMRRSRSNDS